MSKRLRFRKEYKTFLITLFLIISAFGSYFFRESLTSRQVTQSQAQQAVICTIQGGCGGKCNPSQNFGCGYGGCRFWEYCADIDQNGEYSCYDTTSNGSRDPDYALACGRDKANASIPQGARQPTQQPLNTPQSENKAVIRPTATPVRPTSNIIPTPTSSPPQATNKLSGSSCSSDGVEYPSGFCTITSTDVGFGTNMKVFLYCDKNNSNASSQGWVQEQTGTTCPRYNYDSERNTACMANGAKVNDQYKCCSGYSSGGICNIASSKPTATPLPNTTDGKCTYIGDRDCISPTVTKVPTNTATPQPTRKPTVTSSPKPTRTPTPTSRPTATRTPSPTSRSLARQAATTTKIPTATVTSTPRPTATQNPTAPPTFIPTAKPVVQNCTITLNSPTDEQILTVSSQLVFNPCSKTDTEFYRINVIEKGTPGKTAIINVQGISPRIALSTVNNQKAGGFFISGKAYEWNVWRCTNGNCNFALPGSSPKRTFYWLQKLSPTATITVTPTMTPMPTATLKPSPTNIIVPTATPKPSNTPIVASPTPVPVGVPQCSDYSDANGPLSANSIQMAHLGREICSNGRVVVGFSSEAPSNLVNAKEAIEASGYEYFGNSNIVVRAEMVDDLGKMMKDLANKYQQDSRSSCIPFLYSGYRSYEEQEVIWNKLNCEWSEALQMGVVKGTRSYCGAQRPGYSLHQSGLAVDIYCTFSQAANGKNNISMEAKLYQYVGDSVQEYGFYHPIAQDPPHYHYFR